MTALTAAAMVAACSGGEDNSTEPTPTIAITLTPTTATVAQGANTTANLTLTRSGGFTGEVAIAFEGLPAGVTPSAAPPTLGSMVTSSVLTFTASATAATGTANLTVRATGTGVAAKTATIALTVNAAPSFSLAATAATVAAGGTGTSNITITRTGGFAGAVTLAAEGLPTGVTAAFNPNNTTTNASVLTFTAAANAAAGTSTITVRGTATGQTDKTTTLQLTVTAPPGGFTLALQPTALPVQQGTSGNTAVTITRTNGFAGTVNLTATGLPPGVTAAFNPAAATATSTLTLTASGTATVGQATVTVRGNATGITEQTATLTLTVTQATGGSGNTAFEFCTVGQTPLWLAVQDGPNAPWMRVTPTGTKFQFDITQSKGGVAYVTGTSSPTVATAPRSFVERLSAKMQLELLMRNRAMRGVATGYNTSRVLVDGFALTIYYGTQQELNARGTAQCLPGAGKTLNGTVAGLGEQQSANITLGTEATSVSNPNTTYQLTNVPDGALDLIAARTTVTLNPISFALDKLIIRRAQNFANNANIPVLDFGAAEAFDPAQANITIGNLGTDQGYAFTSFFTAAGVNAAGATLLASPFPGPGPFKYYGVPTAKQIPGDLHVALGFGVPNSTTIDQFRFAALFFKDPTDRTVTLGPSLSAATVTAAATAPYVRFRATGPFQAQYDKVIQVAFIQDAPTGPRHVEIFASEGYLSGSTTYDFTLPDFSGVAGWDNNWGPKTGAETEWTVTGFTYTGVGFNSANPVEGSTYQAASRTGTITP